MRITEFLSEESIVPALSATRKDEALLELSKALGRAIPQVPGPRLYSVLSEREKAASTAMEKGVAIPHGRLAELPTLVACFGVSRAGIDFEARDGRPSNFFFALLAPENSAGVHLKALAKISRMFRSDALREGILAATTAKDIYALIVQEDSRA
jgi:PTS system nitrogen regulatory IIA component